MFYALLYYCINREVLHIYAYLIIKYSNVLFRQLFSLAIIIDVIYFRRLDAAEFKVLEIDQNFFFWFCLDTVLIYEGDVHGLYYFDLDTRSILDGLLYRTGLDRSDLDFSTFRKSSLWRLDPDSNI